MDLCGVVGACIVVRVAAADAESLRPTPLMNGLEDGVVLFALFWGGDPVLGVWIAETLVCKASGVRVSLLGCSGAIRDCVLVVVVPGVSVV